MERDIFQPRVPESPLSNPSFERDIVMWKRHFCWPLLNYETNRIPLSSYPERGRPHAEDFKILTKRKDSQELQLFFFQFTENSILAHLLRRKFEGWKWLEETKCSSYLHTCLYSDYPYTWQTGNWSRCSTKCGSGKQTRKLDCAKTGGGKVDSKFCRNTKIPAGSRACYGKLCGKILSCYDSMYMR